MRCNQCWYEDSHRENCVLNPEYIARKKMEREQGILRFNAQGFFQGDVNAKDAREQFQRLIKERTTRETPKPGSTS